MEVLERQLKQENKQLKIQSQGIQRENEKLKRRN